MARDFQKNHMDNVNNGEEMIRQRANYLGEVARAA